MLKLVTLILAVASINANASDHEHKKCSLTSVGGKTMLSCCQLHSIKFVPPMTENEYYLFAEKATPDEQEFSAFAPPIRKNPNRNGPRWGRR